MAEELTSLPLVEVLCYLVSGRRGGEIELRWETTVPFVGWCGVRINADGTVQARYYYDGWRKTTLEEAEDFMRSHEVAAK